MQKYECEICEYVYDPEEGDPENGVAPGTPFENLPEDWFCPTCGVDKDAFKPVANYLQRMQEKKKGSVWRAR